MANEVLAQMNSDTESQITSLQSSISNIDDIINNLDDQIPAVENDVCIASQTRLQEYLTTSKLPAYPGGSVVMGENPIVYGGSLSSWSINAIVVNPDPLIPPADAVVYSISVNWDNDPEIVQLMADWSYGCDYLTRPLTSGASYGLVEQQANMVNVKAMLTESLNKLTASQSVLPRYM